MQKPQTLDHVLSFVPIPYYGEIAAKKVIDSEFQQAETWAKQVFLDDCGDIYLTRFLTRRLPGYIITLIAAENLIYKLSESLM